MTGLRGHWYPPRVVCVSAFRRVASTLLAVAVLCGSRAARGEEPASAPTPAAQAAAFRRLAVEVVATYPHDPAAFTQGLLLHDGTLYESTGNYGDSSLRKVEVETGKVLARTNLPPELFGEGLALVGGELVQLTWREGLALVYDLAGFEKKRRVPYDGEGWGLCFDGQWLIMSDGSDQLYLRDPKTFAIWRRVPVTLAGSPLRQLNELECDGDRVWANVWNSDSIVEIDKQSGAVRSLADAARLLGAEERAVLHPHAVLNGIARDDESDTFLVTGKYWPKLFRVRFTPQP